MTFHEQLTQTVDSLTSHLRDAITQQVHSAADVISASARAEREQAIAAARTAAERDADDRLAAAVADAEARAYAYGKDEALEQLRVVGRDADARLLDAVRALDRARSLTEVLDVLVTRAAGESARAALLLVGGNRLRGWRFAGFDAGVDANETLDVALDESGVIADAVTANAATFADAAEPRLPSFAAASGARDCWAAPIAVAGQVVAVLYADSTSLESATPQSLIPNPFFELLARHASRSLEALVAFKAARMSSGGSAADPQSAVSSAATAADDEVAARRYARLLVSEIRLYHEDEVAAGRREHDLATRLGGEIARARVMYEERVTPQVRGRADYFHEELVRTLADGNPALLESRR